MKDIRTDTDGTPRCWNCGTKCQRCLDHNTSGNGQTYDASDSRKYRKEWEAEQHAGASSALESPAEQLTKLAALRDSGVLSDAEFETQKVRVLAAT